MNERNAAGNNSIFLQWIFLIRLTFPLEANLLGAFNFFCILLHYSLNSTRLKWKIGWERAEYKHLYPPAWYCKVKRLPVAKLPQLSCNLIQKPQFTDQLFTHLSATPKLFQLVIHLVHFLIYVACSRCRAGADVLSLCTHQCAARFCQIIFRAARGWQQFEKRNNPSGCSGYENVVSSFSFIMFPCWYNRTHVND